MEYKKLTYYCKILGLLIVTLLIISTTLSVALVHKDNTTSNQNNNENFNSTILTHIDQYTEEPYDDSAEGILAAYGEDIIKNTYNYFYRDGQKIGNHLACSNCHLQSGTKAFAAPYIGLTSVFPIYIGREDKIESLEERINGCFERSMNGEAIPENGKEMRAIITYIKKISKNTLGGERTEGQGFVKIDIPERKADLNNGLIVFEKQCVNCHGKDGQGEKIAGGKGYTYPPLWGPDSYNDGAGMGRVLTAARFIKGNMPLGATHDSPILTDEEAFDVAAYINSFDRPQKANKDMDYPNLSKKPKDCSYPPYTDTISQEQHKYGPFNF